MAPGSQLPTAVVTRIHPGECPTPISGEKGRRRRGGAWQKLCATGKVQISTPASNWPWWSWPISWWPTSDSPAGLPIHSGSYPIGSGAQMIPIPDTAHLGVHKDAKVWPKPEARAGNQMAQTAPERLDWQPGYCLSRWYRYGRIQLISVLLQSPRFSF